MLLWRGLRAAYIGPPIMMKPLMGNTEHRGVHKTLAEGVADLDLV